MGRVLVMVVYRRTHKNLIHIAGNIVRFQLTIPSATVYFYVVFVLCGKQYSELRFLSNNL